MSTDRRDRAVVLGGGMAGLLAARVLADEFASVTVVERDLYPTAFAQRRGVPQGHHSHGLLPLGQQIAEDLLPGLTNELITAGAVPGDILDNVRWFLHGRQLRQTVTGLTLLSASRPLIEGIVRRRVAALSNVTLLNGHDIVGLSPSADHRRIASVRVTSRYEAASRILPADLVIDATGRGSRTPRWLAELGYAAPDEDRVGLDLTYASAVFELVPEVFGNDVVVVTGRYPGQLSGGVMQRIEGGRVLVTLAGVLGKRPPLDPEGFHAYAQDLAVPDTYEMMCSARPLGDAVGFRLPTYIRRRYERLTEFPAGFLVVGDAACSFNPVYAQGMSVAAAQAAALRTELRHGGDPDASRFFGAVSRILDAPWALAVGPDMALAGVTGPVLPRSPLTTEYLANLQLAATQDAEIAAAFIRVASLVDPPPALLRPELARRVASVAAAGSQPEPVPAPA